MNKATFTGNIGGDAIIKDAAGKKVMEFSVGVAIGTKDNPRTLWVKCSKWSEKTALQPYLLKGTKVLVNGNVDVQAFTNNQGQAQASITLRVDDIELIGSKLDAPPTQQPTQQPQSNAAGSVSDAVVDYNLDLPF